MEYLKFNIRSSYYMTTRKVLVMVGQAEFDDVSTFNWLFSGDLMPIATILSIEMVLTSDDESLPGLLIEYSDEEQKELLEAIRESHYVFLGSR